MRWHTLLPPILLAAACGGDDGTTGPRHSIQIVGASEVTGTPLDTVPQQLAVRVTTLDGRPSAGARVTWSTSDDGTLLPESPVTDEEGIARAEWVLGWRPGVQEARATSGELEAVVFTATAEGFQAIGLSVGDGIHQCAIAPEGALFCWGPNDHGQLGDGTMTSSDAPVAVQLDQPVGQAITSVSPFGDGFTCALTTAGEVHCWGGNDGGQLGNGTFAGSLSPVRPSLPSQAYKGISAEGGGVCATAEGGDAHCWGVNREGRFGIGQGESVEPLPVRVEADFPWRHVELGDDRACGVREGGQVYCWGARPTWLGIGVDTNTVLPLPVLNSPPMDSVTLSGWHQCGVTADHLTHCWGQNHNIGFVTTDTLIPYPIALEVPPSLRSVHSIFHSTFGLGIDDKGYWWGPPPHATGGGPESPVLFSDEITLSAIGTNDSEVCGVEATTGTVYCWTMGFELPLVVAVPPPSSVLEAAR
jgi:hypothetical protein